MTLGKYALLAQRTSRKEPGIDHMTNGILGLIGEAGEVVETVKKWKFQSEHDMPMPVCKLIEELGGTVTESGAISLDREGVEKYRAKHKELEETECEIDTDRVELRVSDIPEISVSDIESLEEFIDWKE